MTLGTWCHRGKAGKACCFASVKCEAKRDRGNKVVGYPYPYLPTNSIFRVKPPANGRGKQCCVVETSR